MGRHYRADVKDGSIGFLKAMWTSARWCHWVEPSEGAIGEGKGVLFYRNRNGLGTAPLKLKEIKPAVGNAKMGMVVGADEDLE
jgi:omega-6 fatty acid desaturase (delta-12 desaturase)